MTTMITIKNGREYCDILNAVKIPPDRVFVTDTVYVEGVFIPQCRHRAERVWFVSDRSGREFGQYGNKDAAIAAAERVA